MTKFAGMKGVKFDYEAFEKEMKASLHEGCAVAAFEPDEPGGTTGEG